MPSDESNSPVTVHIDLAQEVVRLLADNEIDLIERLRRDGLDIKRGPANQRNNGAKSVELTILASAAAAPLVAASITRIIDALGRVVRITQDNGTPRQAQESTNETSISLMGLKVQLTDHTKEG